MQLFLSVLLLLCTEMSLLHLVLQVFAMFTAVLWVRRCCTAHHIFFILSFWCIKSITTLILPCLTLRYRSQVISVLTDQCWLNTDVF